MARIPIALAAAAGGVLFLAPPVAAQSASSPDPQSPAGVEYQLPLDRARQDAAGGGGVGSDSPADPGGKAPLFGKGIENSRAGSTGKAGAGSGEPASAASGAGGTVKRDSSGHPAGKTGAGAPSVKRAGFTASSGSDGGGGDFRMGLIIGAVLGAGIVLGLLLRRGLRDTSG